MKLILVLFLLLGLEVFSSEKPQLTDNQVVITLQENTPSKETIYNYLVTRGVLHPSIAYRQILLETGGLTSRIYLENNNLFGMRLAKKRKTTAIGERYGHAVYKSWEDSVEDYILWQKMFKRTPIHTETHYYKVLDKYYCPTPGYSKVLKSLKIN